MQTNQLPKRAIVIMNSQRQHQHLLVVEQSVYFLHKDNWIYQNIVKKILFKIEII